MSQVINLPGIAVFLKKDIRNIQVHPPAEIIKNDKWSMSFGFGKGKYIFKSYESEKEAQNALRRYTIEWKNSLDKKEVA